MSELATGKTYDRQPGETNKSWAAFQDYLAMDGNRSTKDLHKLYASAAPGEKVPTKSASTLAAWRDDHSWIPRARAYDTDLSNSIQEQATKRRRDKAVAEIEKFVDFNAAAGQLGSGVCLKLQKQLDDFASPKTVDKERDRIAQDRGDGRDADGLPIIKNWSDAGKVSRIIAAIGPYALEQWSRAAGVERILSQHEATRERS